MTSGSRSPRTHATEPLAQDLLQPLPLPVEEPAQSAPLPPAPAVRPTPKELALAHLPSPSQRQLVEALADQQSLPDEHPIWSIVAMLGAVVSGAPPRQDLNGFESTLAQKSDTEAVRTEIRALTGELRILESQTEALSTEVKALHARLDDHLDEIAKVISGAANLNRKIPEFLDGLKAVLLPKTKKLQR
ncbi:MAG: hypothetical protein M0Z39_05015 [Actinomycetota bacterium]|nr:hypothetical protein [Actinomycetota bacterium]